MDIIFALLVGLAFIYVVLNHTKFLWNTMKIFAICLIITEITEFFLFRYTGIVIDAFFAAEVSTAIILLVDWAKHRKPWWWAATSM